MTKISTNQSPYFDDYLFMKNFQQVLFKPNFPVQARELNQLQSILGGHIKSISDHIFKNGSKISNCRTSMVKRDYVRLMDTFADSTETVEVADLNGGLYTLVGEVTNVKAKFVMGTDLDEIDPATLFVVYTDIGVDGVIAQFKAGETVRILDENDMLVKRVVVRCVGCAGSNLTDEIDPIGKSLFFAIDEGVVYYDGMFIHVERQEIIVEKYSQFDESGQNISREEYKVGLDVVHKIITVDEDSSLADNSLGYENASAPGSDRYKAYTILTKRTINVNDGDNFILLAKVREFQQIEYLKGDADYADIMNEIAKRTYEQAGNFTVTPYKTKFYEDLKQSPTDAKGWSLQGEDAKLVAVVSPAISYVKGYRNETIMDSIVKFEKARDTEQIKSNTTFLSDRVFVKVRAIGSASWINKNTGTSVLGGTEILLYDGVPTTNDVSGTQVGTMKVVDQRRIAGTKNDYQMYVYDIKMVSNNKPLSAVKSMRTQDGLFVGEAILENGKLEIYNANDTQLLYDLGHKNIKSLRAVGNSEAGSVYLNIRKKLTANLDNNGQATFVSASDESFLGFNQQDHIAWVGTSTTAQKLDLDATKLTVAGSSMVINLGSAYAGQTVYLTANLLKMNQLEKTKTLTKKVATLANQVSGNLGANVLLGVADANKIVSIKLINSSDNTIAPIDITSEYRLETGQTDTFYGESYLVRTVARSSIGTAMRLLVEIEYFEHSGTSGFFTVDSYSQMINDETLNKTYEDIPTYKATNGIEYRMAETIDFRPIKIGSTITLNSVMPVQGSTMIYDVEYYLPRIDVLSVDKDGKIYVKKGIASLSPVKPKPDEDSMELYEIHLGAYTYDLNDVKTRFIENKRYTMRDIGKIEKRVENLEYYTTLSALESATLNLTITDDNGLNRYKNGMLVDGFNNFNASDVTHKEYKASLDRRYSQLRPQFHSYNVLLEPNKEKCTNCVWYGNVAMLAHTNEIVSSNPYATKHVSVNPYLLTKKVGNMVMSPNVDTWSDTETLPTVVSNIDTGAEALTRIAEASGLLGTDWGSWNNLNVTTQSNSTSSSNWWWNTTTTNTTTTTNQQRVGTKTTVESKRDSYTIDDVVKDVEIVPYIRSQRVEFYGSGLKANTTVYAYFDGEDVTEHCRIITQVLDDTSTKDYTIFGAKGLRTDNNGEIIGEFRIPANRFFTGTKQFVLTSDPKNSGDADMETTRAVATYFAGGISQTKQSYTMNIVTPVLQTEQVTENRSTTTVSRSTSQTMNNASWAWLRSDPIAQGFAVDENSFITKLDLYFQSIDQKSDEIWVELRTTQNGYPTTTALARKTYTPAQLNALGGVSDNSNQKITVEFDVPVYVEAKTMYCFVVGGYSPETRVWVAKLGEEVVNMVGKSVENPPSQYTSFRSLNGQTWNAEQYETIKYNLHRAVFTDNKMGISLRDSFSDAEYIKLEKDPIEILANVQRVRIHAPNHGLTVTDRVSLSLLDDLPFIIQVVNSAPPQIGQKVTTVSGGGYVKDIVKSNLGLNYYEMKLTNTWGILNLDEQFTGHPTTRYVKDNFLLRANGNTNTAPSVQLNESLGYIKNNIREKFKVATIGGVDISKFNAEHIVTEVDTIDSFIVSLPENFTVGGRFGGDTGIAFSVNKKYDVINVSGEYLAYDSDENWNMSLIGHGDANSIFSGANYITQTSIPFNLKEDVHLGQPCKLASQANATRVIGTSRRSIEVTANFDRKTKYVSPVINMDSFSATLVSNRVGNYTKASYEVEPKRTYVEETGQGVQEYKHITVNALLQDSASDLRILFDAYKDVNADFDVYVKVISPYETRTNDDVEWIHLDLIQKTRSSNNLGDMIEYEFTASEFASKWVQDFEFIAYRVKIVGRSDNSSKPPMFEKLRVIAIT